VWVRATDAWISRVVLWHSVVPLGKAGLCPGVGASVWL
jgi:hypothetical protein